MKILADLASILTMPLYLLFGFTAGLAIRIWRQNIDPNDLMRQK